MGVCMLLPGQLFMAAALRPHHVLLVPSTMKQEEPRAGCVSSCCPDLCLAANLLAVIHMMLLLPVASSDVAAGVTVLSKIHV